MNIKRCLLAAALALAGVVPAVAFTAGPAAATTCDKIQGDKPCVTGYVQEGQDNPNIIQGNICSSDYSTLGAYGGDYASDICMRWIRVGGQAVQGPLGVHSGADEGSFFHEAALAHACSYATKDASGFYHWNSWPQSGSWHTLGMTPNGTGLGFCTANYGSAFGAFYSRNSAGDGDQHSYILTQW